MFSKIFHRFFKAFDIFGEPIKFTLNHKYLQTSILGGFLSVCLISLFMGLSFQVFLDVFQHKNFLSYSQEIYYENPPEIPMTADNLNIVITFSDPRMNSGQYFKLDIIQAYTIFDPKEKKSLRQKNYIIPEKCNINHIREDLRVSYLSLDNSTNLETYLCINPNSTLLMKGTHSSSDFSYFYIKISACQNTINTTCVSQQTIDSVFNDNSNKIYLNIYAGNNLVNPNDFNSPISSFLEDKIYVLLDRKSYKEKNFYFNQNKIYADIDFISNDLKEQYQTFTYENNFDETTIKLDKIDNNTLFSAIYFRSNIIAKSHYRICQKLGIYISYLGGFWTILYFIFALLAKKYNSQRTQLKIANALYEFNSDFKNNKKKMMKFSKNNEITTETQVSFKKQKIRQKCGKFELQLLNFLEENKGVKLLFDIKFIIKDFFTRNREKANVTQKILRKKAEQSIGKDLDIVHILKKIKSFDKLRNLFLTEDQRYIFEFFHKTCINPYSDSHFVTRSTQQFFMRTETKSFYKSAKPPDTIQDYMKLYECYQTLKNEPKNDINRKILNEIKPEIVNIFEQRDFI